MCDDNVYSEAVFNANSSPYDGNYDDLKPANLLKGDAAAESDIVIHIVASYFSGTLQSEKFSFNGVGYEIVEPAIV